MKSIYHEKYIVVYTGYRINKILLFIIKVA